MKTFLIFSIFGALLASLEYGFFHGIGGIFLNFFVTLLIIIWLQFFFAGHGPYFFAAGSALVAEMGSPYAFGFIIIMMLGACATASFLSKKVFTNRSVYSYLATITLSVLSFYVLAMISAITTFFYEGAAFIQPFPMNLSDIIGIASVNFVFAILLFVVTNLTTKRMRAAFIMR